MQQNKPPYRFYLSPYVFTSYLSPYQSTSLTAPPRRSDSSPLWEPSVLLHSFLPLPILHHKASTIYCRGFIFTVFGYRNPPEGKCCGVILRGTEQDEKLRKHLRSFRGQKRALYLLSRCLNIYVIKFRCSENRFFVSFIGHKSVVAEAS